MLGLISYCSKRTFITGSPKL
uniref:Uncharacterized protein n=1 Tax=Anguilla anguilla TaxID=7936 RepID=A0A0E9TGF4_ANGAN